MDDKDISQRLTIISVTTTIAGVTAWYVWQLITIVPLLQLILAIFTTITIILAQVIVVWWLAGKIMYQRRMSDLSIREEMRREHLPKLPPDLLP